MSALSSIIAQNPDNSKLKSKWRSSQAEVEKARALFHKRHQ